MPDYTWIQTVLEKWGAKNKAYDSDVDGVFDLAAIPTITRDKLEYPTEDVTFAYLLAINKAIDRLSHSESPVVVTVDSFTDKATEGIISIYYGVFFARREDAYIAKNAYFQRFASGESGTDHTIRKVIDGTVTELANEGIDLATEYKGTYAKFNVSGSTLSAYRVDPTTPKISATDTDLASGQFGVRLAIGGTIKEDWTGSVAAKLLAPSTELPKALAIVECEITGSGNDEDPIRPDLTQGLKWGAFDYKGEATMLITITGDQSGAIQDQIEHAKSKNLKVLKPPEDYSEAIEQYRQLRQHFPEWIAGKDNYAYQTLGHEDFEKFQVADTYHGNIIEGYKPDAYKNVPDWEMRKTLAMWKERLKHTEVAKLEAEKHLKKLEEVEKKGW